MLSSNFVYQTKKPILESYQPSTTEKAKPFYPVKEEIASIYPRKFSQSSIIVDMPNHYNQLNHSNLNQAFSFPGELNLYLKPIGRIHSLIQSNFPEQAKMRTWFLYKKKKHPSIKFMLSIDSNRILVPIRPTCSYTFAELWNIILQMVFRCWERNDVKDVIGIMAKMDDHAVSILGLLIFCPYSISLSIFVLVCRIDDMDAYIYIYLQIWNSHDTSVWYIFIPGHCWCS